MHTIMLQRVRARPAYLCLWVVLQMVWAVVPKQVLHPRQEQLVRGTLLQKHTKLTQPRLHSNIIDAV